MNNEDVTPVTKDVTPVTIVIDVRSRQLPKGKC